LFVLQTCDFQNSANKKGAGAPLSDRITYIASHFKFAMFSKFHFHGKFTKSAFAFSKSFREMCVSEAVHCDLHKSYLMGLV